MKEVNDCFIFKNIGNYFKIEYGEGDNKAVIHRKSFQFENNNTLKTFEKFKYINRALFQYGIVKYEINNNEVDYTLSSYINNVKKHFEETLDFHGQQLRMECISYYQSGFESSVFSFHINVHDIANILANVHIENLGEELSTILDNTFEQKLLNFPYDIFQFEINEIVNGQRPIVQMVGKDNKSHKSVSFFIDMIELSDSIEISVINIPVYNLKTLKSLNLLLLAADFLRK